MSYINATDHYTTANPPSPLASLFWGLGGGVLFIPSWCHGSDYWCCWFSVIALAMGHDLQQLSFLGIGGVCYSFLASVMAVIIGVAGFQ